MTTTSAEAIDQAQIVKLIENWSAAIRSKDLEASLLNYSKNISLFDVTEPLQYFGFDSVRKRAAEWFATFDGPLDYEMHDLRIATNGDVAFSHSLNHVSGKKTDGKKLEMWWRATVCYRKMSDHWVVVHEHNSVPFNPDTGKASIDLQPPFSAGENGGYGGIENVRSVPAAFGAATVMERFCAFFKAS